jgi:hypothetical protein
MMINISTTEEKIRGRETLIDKCDAFFLSSLR